MSAIAIFANRNLASNSKVLGKWLIDNIITLGTVVFLHKYREVALEGEEI